MTDTTLTVNEVTEISIVVAEPKSSPRTPTLHRQFSWSVLAHKLLSNPVMTWLRIPLSSLPGETTKLKQSNLISCLSTKNVKIQTMTEEDFIYVRTIDPLRR
jgi:hypothetical protein